MKPLEIGDRVAYSKRFLRSIKTPATCEEWRMQGTLIAFDGDRKPRVATVEWDKPRQHRVGDPSNILETNLTRTDDLAGMNLPD